MYLPESILFLNNKMKENLNYQFPSMQTFTCFSRKGNFIQLLFKQINVKRTQ